MASLKFERNGFSVGIPRGHKKAGWGQFTCPPTCPDGKLGRRCTVHWGPLAGIQTRSKK